MKNEEVKEVMWLRDLLPSFVPNARIATFSYLSDWFTYKKGVKTKLRSLGNQLLNVLERDRQKWGVCFIEDSLGTSSNQTYCLQAQCQPIIFIGRGMGGLVIKRANIISQILGFMALADLLGHGTRKQST